MIVQREAFATATRRQTGRSVRRAAWLYASIRLTGVLLAVLVCGHFFVMHLASDVAATNASFIARRWSQALWVGWDWLMLAAALLHGALGTSIALRDYSSGRFRAALRTILIGATAALFAFGSVVIAMGAGT